MVSIKLALALNRLVKTGTVLNSSPICGSSDLSSASFIRVACMCNFFNDFFVGFSSSCGKILFIRSLDTVH